MEEYFEDPSFIYYLIDNVERAMNSSQEDLDQYMEKVRLKTMKKYVKTLKQDMNNKNSLNLLKKLGTMFTVGSRKASIIKEPEEPIREEKKSPEKKGPSTLEQLKRNAIPPPFKQSESNFNLNFFVWIWIKSEDIVGTLSL